MHVHFSYAIRFRKVQWQPEWYGHEEHVSNNDQVGSSKRPILGYDELSIWKRYSPLLTYVIK